MRLGDCQMSEKIIRPVILVCGKTGAGKTSLIKAVTPQGVVPTDAIGSGLPVTKGFKVYTTDSALFVDAEGMEQGQTVEAYKEFLGTEILSRVCGEGADPITHVWYCIDGTSTRVVDADKTILSFFGEHVILVVTKSELLNKNQVKSMLEAANGLVPADKLIPVSSETGVGLPRLMDSTVDMVGAVLSESERCGLETIWEKVNSVQYAKWQEICERDARRYILWASTRSFAIATCFFLPFSEAIPLSLNEIYMVSKICAVYGRTDWQDVLSMISTPILGTMFGRFISALLPPILKSAAAASVTYGVGEMVLFCLKSRKKPTLEELKKVFEREKKKARAIKWKQEQERLYDRYKGMLWGLVVGDCLGSPVQFSKKDDHVRITEMVACPLFGLPPGYWTDDSSMAFCIMESYVRKGKYDLKDVGDNFVKWYKNGFWSSMNGRPFDVGKTTGLACKAIQEQGTLVNGSEDSQGNGSIMRFAPSYIVAQHEQDPMSVIYAISDLTHSSAKVHEVLDQLTGIIEEHLVGKRTTQKSIYANRAEVDNGGWVVATLNAALWAFNTTEDFQNGMIEAVNLGGDSDTIGAVYGQIAGAFYGFSSIPKQWVEKVKDWKKIDELIETFLDKLVR